MMCLLQACILNIVAVKTQRRSALGQMKIKFGLAAVSSLMRDVAGVATHIERSMAASLLGHVQSLLVAIETKVLPVLSRFRLHHLILVVALVRVMALDAVAHRRRMHRPFNRGRILFRVATEAERLRSRGDELVSCYVLVDSDFMAAQTSRRDCRMNGLAFGLVFVAFKTFCRVDILVERDRMFLGPRGCCDGRQEQHQSHDVGEGLSNAPFCGGEGTVWERCDHCRLLHV